MGPRFDRFPCFVQPKLNGVRALYQSGFFQSRDEKIWAHKKLVHLLDELATFSAVLKNTMLDGELYVHGWRLQRINGAVAVNSETPRDDTHLVEYHVFDAIDERGFQCSFAERYLALATLLASAQLTHIKPVPTAYASSRQEMDWYFKQYVGLGYEGLMARPDGPYILGETPHGTRKNSPYLWKYKAWKDGEYLCVGVTQGEGKADIGIGALVLAIQRVGQEQLEFNVGTGFTDEDRVEFMLNQPIGKMVRVRYVEKTADGIPYPCRFEAVMS